MSDVCAEYQKRIWHLEAEIKRKDEALKSSRAADYLDSAAGFLAQGTPVLVEFLDAMRAEAKKLRAALAPAPKDTPA